MNSTANTIYSSTKTVFHTALLFALAIMLLVISCPLKRVLQKDFISTSSSPVRSNQININQTSASDYYISNDECGVKQKAELTKFTTSQQVNIPAFINLPFISNQAGFGLHHFLSRTDSHSGILVYAHASSLPIYLQHLRLRI